MTTLNMKAVLRATGLKAETLRSWERRYQAISPKRNSAARRIYSLEEVERLKLLSELVKKGRSISTIAGLTDSELVSQTVRRADMRSIESNLEKEALNLMNLLKTHNLNEMRIRLNRLLFEISPRDFVFFLCPNVVTQVGLEYRKKSLSPAHEHAVLNMFKTILFGIFNSISGLDGSELSSETILVATRPEEIHEISVISSSITCRLKGYHTIYLGQCEIEELLRHFEKSSNIRAVLFSEPWITDQQGINSLAQYIYDVDRKLPKKCEIWIGRNLFINLDRSNLRNSLRTFESMWDLEKHLDRLATGRDSDKL